MKVDTKNYGKSREKLTLDDLDGGDTIVLTCASVEDVTFDDNGKERKSLVMTFEESGEKSYWPNKTSTGYLVEAISAESDEWIGQRIPLEAVHGDYQGKPYDSLWVAAPERWASILKATKPVKRGKSAR